MTNMFWKGLWDKKKKKDHPIYARKPDLVLINVKQNIR